VVQSNILTHFFVANHKSQFKSSIIATTSLSINQSQLSYVTHVSSLSYFDTHLFVANHKNNSSSSITALVSLSASQSSSVYVVQSQFENLLTHSLVANQKSQFISCVINLVSESSNKLLIS
jgi:hypothetical protein